MNKDFLTIENVQQLQELCKQLKNSDWLAVDTEFERTQTYYPELCLVQIANQEISAIVDPIAVDDLTPLYELLYDKSTIKVFHSAHQDLEIFLYLKGSVPGPIFDTQIAAPLLGYAEQIGYGKLVEQVTGTELGKAFTRSDWKQRPLKRGQLEYAINDVIYLGMIYMEFVDKLQVLNRTSWLDKDFLALEEAERYQPNPNKVWKKIREARKLKGKKLAILQKLAAWRETTAREENRPRNWLVRDDALVDMAQLLPEDKKALSRIKGVQDRLVKNSGEILLGIIHDAENITPEPLEKIVKKEKLSNQEEAIVDALSAIVRLQAEAHEMNPTSLATRKELQEFLQNKNGSELLNGWRKPLIGDALCEFMQGKQTMCLSEKKLSIISK